MKEYSQPFLVQHYVEIMMVSDKTLRVFCSYKEESQPEMRFFYDRSKWKGAKLA